MRSPVFFESHPSQALFIQLNHKGQKQHFWVRFDLISNRTKQERHSHPDTNNKIFEPWLSRFSGTRTNPDTRLTIGKPVNWQYISKVPNMTLRKQVLLYLFTDNSQFLMIYCQFLSISRREETDICNCQQPCQQSALPTEVLPLDEGAEIWRHVHYLPA